MFESVDYKLRVAALIIAFIIAIVVWIIAYIKYRKWVKQRKIDWLIKKIRERAEDSGNESNGNQEKLSTMVNIGHLRLLNVNNL
nr:vpu protein [Human immunodeficiency virus 1]QHB20372.1 vpu protein [Human immunodeficiency virus 1]